eukprot:IDg2803t1
MTENASEIFSSAHSSFDVQKNWEICTLRSIDVPLNLSISDYSPIIGKALAMLSSIGGTVRLRKGTYRVSKPIEMPSHTCMIGAGMLETFLELTARAPSFSDKGVIRASKGERITIFALTVDGSRSMQYENEEYGRSGVYLELVNHAWCRNVRTRNHANHGFYPHGSDGRLLYHSFFEACISEGNARDGFKLGNTAYASVFNSIAQRNGRYGVSVAGASTHSMIKSTRIYNNGARVGGCGAAVFAENGKRPSDTLVLGSSIMNSTRAGICIASAQNINVTTTTIANHLDADATCYSLTDVRGFIEMNSTCDVISDKNFAGRPSSSHDSTMPTPSPT